MRLATIVAAAAFAAIASGTTEAANAAAVGPSPYVVAAVPFIEGLLGGGVSIGTQLHVQLCVNDDFTGCPAHPSETVTFAPVGVASVGTTTWVDASSAGFGSLVALITNGVVDQLNWEVTVFPSGGGGGFGMSEPMFFGAQTGPSGVDLAGYAIDRIGVRVDSFSFDGQLLTLRWTFLFEGTIANADACKNGGWHALRGPDATPFNNQGDCIQQAVTGM
jgi:hypothetical protein